MATIDVAEIPEFEAEANRVFEAESGVTYITIHGRQGTFSIPFSPEAMRGVRVMEGDRIRVSFDVSEGRNGVRLVGRTCKPVGAPVKP